MLTAIPDDPSLVIEGIQVQLEDIRLSGAGPSSTCHVEVQLSWNDGVSFSSVQYPGRELHGGRDIHRRRQQFHDGLGAATHTWNHGPFSDDAFDVRLAGRARIQAAMPRHGVAFDLLRVEVFYRTTGVATPQPVVAPDGTVLASQNFWGSMQSYGAPAFQGDAHMTRYATRKSPDNDAFDPEEYYNYAVVVPSGASNAQVHIFDPGFCDVGRDRNDGQQGTDESWTVDGGNSRGNPTTKPVSAFYELWDTLDTPYDRADDVLLFTSGNQFRRLNFYDPTLNGENGASGSGAAPTSCTGEGWHNDWWQLASGLAPGTYRVHTASKVLPDIADDQSDTTALNGFAIWAKASGGVPRVHGLGAMEAYFPLPAGGPSLFYLAQIDDVYAGKWMDIDLWDPGDTGGLSADLQILMPTASGYTPATFYFNENPGTDIPAGFGCGPSTSSARTSIETSSGSGSHYNGSWLRLCIQIPNDYVAPTPGGEPEPGWWKILYQMGSGTSPSTDLTTWKVSIRGNPVHLVVGG